MTTQQTEALQCAADLEYSIARHGMQDAFTLNAYRAMKMVRTQQARITDLEAQLEAIGAGGVSGPLIGQPQAMPDLSQLTERGAKAWAGVDAQGPREGFTAADMATVSAQGFRDGVASVSAGWISVDERLPEPGNPVLLDIGKKYPIRAMWAAKHTVQAADDDTDWGEYVEEDDMYYAPEGWYEWNQCEDNHWRVTETPRAWMPLPPTSAEGVEHG